MLTVEHVTVIFVRFAVQPLEAVCAGTLVEVPRQVRVRARVVAHGAILTRGTFALVQVAIAVLTDGARRTAARIRIDWDLWVNA